MNVKKDTFFIDECNAFYTSYTRFKIDKEYYNHKYRILKDKELNLLLFDIIQIDNFFGSHVNKNYVQHIQKFSIIHDNICTNFVFHP